MKLKIHCLSLVRWGALLFAFGIAMLPGGLSLMSIACMIGCAIGFGICMPNLIKAIYIHVHKFWRGSDFMREEITDFFIWLLFVGITLYCMGMSARCDFCDWKFFLIVWASSYFVFMHIMLSVFTSWREYTYAGLCFVKRGIFIGSVFVYTIVFFVSPFVAVPFWALCGFVLLIQLVFFCLATRQNVLRYGDRVDYAYEPPCMEYDISDFRYFFPLILFSLLFPLFRYAGDLGRDVHVRGVDASFFRQVIPMDWNKWGDIVFNKEVLECCQDCRVDFCKQLIKNGLVGSYVDILEHYAKESPRHLKLLTNESIFVRDDKGVVMRPVYKPELDMVEAVRNKDFHVVEGHVSDIQISPELVRKISDDHNHAGRHYIADKEKTPDLLGEGYVFDMFLNGQGFPVVAFLSVRLRKIVTVATNKQLNSVQPNIRDVRCFRVIADKDSRINDAIAENVLSSGLIECSRSGWIDRIHQDSVLTNDEVLQLYDDWTKRVDEDVRSGHLPCNAKNGFVFKVMTWCRSLWEFLAFLFSPIAMIMSCLGIKKNKSVAVVDCYTQKAKE